MNKKISGQEGKNVINEINLNEAVIQANTQAEPEENETTATVNEIVTPSIQPNVTEEEINSDYIGTEEQETTNNEQTEEEKVIELVKETYGTEQGVTFNIANKDGNIYHVSVNDTNTTAVLAWYNVDISTGAVTQ